MATNFMAMRPADSSALIAHIGTMINDQSSLLGPAMQRLSDSVGVSRSMQILQEAGVQAKERRMIKEENVNILQTRTQALVIEPALQFESAKKYADAYRKIGEFDGLILPQDGMSRDSLLAQAEFKRLPGMTEITQGFDTIRTKDRFAAHTIWGGTEESLGPSIGDMAPKRDYSLEEIALAGRTGDMAALTWWKNNSLPSNAKKNLEMLGYTLVTIPATPNNKKTQGIVALGSEADLIQRRMDKAYLRNVERGGSKQNAQRIFQLETAVLEAAVDLEIRTDAFIDKHPQWKGERARVRNELAARDQRPIMDQARRRQELIATLKPTSPLDFQAIEAMVRDIDAFDETSFLMSHASPEQKKSLEFDKQIAGFSRERQDLVNSFKGKMDYISPNLVGMNWQVKNKLEGYEKIVSDTTGSFTASEINNARKRLKDMKGIQTGLMLYSTSRKLDDPEQASMKSRLQIAKEDILEGIGPQTVVTALDAVGDFFSNLERTSDATFQETGDHTFSLLGKAYGAVAAGAKAESFVFDNANKIFQTISEKVPDGDQSVVFGYNLGIMLDQAGSGELADDKLQKLNRNINSILIQHDLSMQEVMPEALANRLKVVDQNIMTARKGKAALGSIDPLEFTFAAGNVVGTENLLNADVRRYEAGSRVTVSAIDALGRAAGSKNPDALSQVQGILGSMGAIPQARGGNAATSIREAFNSGEWVVDPQDPTREIRRTPSGNTEARAIR